MSITNKKFKTSYNRVLRRKDKQNLLHADEDFSCLEGNEIKKYFDTWNLD